MRLVNLTPHRITIRPDGGPETVLEPCGAVARVATEAALVGHVDGVPVVRAVFGPLTGLPEPQDGVLFICSTLVAQAAAAAGRRDVLAPDTSPASAIRSADGQIEAVRRLQIFAEVSQ